VSEHEFLQGLALENASDAASAHALVLVLVLVLACGLESWLDHGSERGLGHGSFRASAHPWERVSALTSIPSRLFLLLRSCQC
jgi:hypothetical protein